MPDPANGARANAQAALTLLGALRRQGLRHLVLCPGSRSAPLAVAAGLLEPRGLRLHTAIDERSAAFFALGLGRALGQPAAVVTTSGTAVAQLLPAAVEADLGTIPLLLLSADRPQRLKNCGANQAVPQERFLLACCRRLLEGAPSGLSNEAPSQLWELAAEAYSAACGDGRTRPAGPVHLNLPFEEPLHVDGADLAALDSWLERPAGLDGTLIPDIAAPEASAALVCLPVAAPPSGLDPAAAADLEAAIPRLDPDRAGVVVAGPWRGRPQQWQAHVRALRRWQQRSGWPLLADALSGLRGLADLQLVSAYDLLLLNPDRVPSVGQVLRLGPLPASRRLQRWLETCGGRQVLVSEGDPRRLDPLGCVPAGGQWSGGLADWVEAILGAADGAPAVARVSPASRQPARRWLELEAAAQQALEHELGNREPGPLSEREGSPAGSGVVNGEASCTASGDRNPAASGPTSGTAGSQRPPASDESRIGDLVPSEPWLARSLSRLLPAGLPVMLASSSPVRDWESFAAADAPWRPIHGFRGASGIDGTLSIACGLAEALGRLVLVSGDLALLHDANGWLWVRQLRGRLTVVLIDNGGGGIFEQLPIRAQPPDRLDFERLFAMPQAIDQLALAALHGVPGRRLRAAMELPAALAWALEQPVALLELRTRRQRDAELRQQLRLAAGEAAARSDGRMTDQDPSRP